jgi:hypothetical protein
MFKESHVSFKASNNFIQKLFDEAEIKISKNIAKFGDVNVLTEGTSLYPNVWLETQPMGGEMYAKRNIEIAVNNQLVFMNNQREDGRLPGMISLNNDGTIHCDYDWLQGYCFPTHAFNMYFLAKEDKDYLEKLYDVLVGFDNYLWKYRDSDGDGCLEVWCIWDTGEDFSTRFYEAPNSWGGESAPYGKAKLPYESMDLMGYSYNGRYVLSVISEILKNGKEQYWRKKSDEVKEKIRSYLWIEEKNACYDRDCNNEILDVLIHNNLRVMYFGAFTQDMADNFIKYHLLNPNEFWTPLPLPSIAISEKLFRNNSHNDWSGQPEGLTYQRAIMALENYGHFAEVTLLGEKLIKAVGKYCVFTQQFDPFTMEPSLKENKDFDGYGPTILAVLEYIAKMYGIHMNNNTIYWSGLSFATREHRYSQTWFENEYYLENDAATFCGFRNGERLFECSAFARVVTDFEGNVIELIGIDTIERTVEITVGDKKTSVSIKPNEKYKFSKDFKPVLSGKVSFDYPFRGE